MSLHIKADLLAGSTSLKLISTEQLPINRLRVSQPSIHYTYILLNSNEGTPLGSGQVYQLCMQQHEVVTDTGVKL